MMITYRYHSESLRVDEPLNHDCGSDLITKLMVLVCEFSNIFVEGKGKEMIRYTIIVLSLTIQWRHS